MPITTPTDPSEYGKTKLLQRYLNDCVKQKEEELSLLMPDQEIKHTATKAQLESISHPDFQAIWKNLIPYQKEILINISQNQPELNECNNHHILAFSLAYLSFLDIMIDQKLVVSLIENYSICETLYNLYKLRTEVIPSRATIQLILNSNQLIINVIWSFGAILLAEIKKPSARPSHYANTKKNLISQINEYSTAQARHDKKNELARRPTSPRYKQLTATLGLLSRTQANNLWSNINHLSSRIAATTNNSKTLKLPKLRRKI